MKKIFLVEDDKGIVDNLIEFLTTEGFEVESAPGQKEAIERLEETSFDLILLDVSLSNGNGFALCTFIRENMNCPVIFLTASDDEYSVVSGLDMGADDYVSKPFRPRELVSRINRVLRSSGKVQSVLKVQDVEIDTKKAVVHKGNDEIFLSALEYRILLVLFHNQGTLLTRERLLQEIWDVSGEYVNDNTLTVYIKRLREKMENDPVNPQIIQTVRGMGYRVKE